MQARPRQGDRRCPDRTLGQRQRLAPDAPCADLAVALALVLGLFLLPNDARCESAPSEGLEVATSVREAYRLLDDERYQAAKEQFEGVLASDPSDPDAREGLAWTLLALGDLDGASVEADALLAGDPDDEARRDRWLMLISQIPARRAEAIEGYRQRVAQAPKNLDLRLHLAEVLSWTEGRTDEAVDVYRGILTMAPGYPDARLGLARTLSWIGRHDEAIPIFDGLIAENPRGAEALFGRAQTAAWMRDYGTAERLARQGLEVAPDDDRFAALLEEVAPAAELVRRGYRGTSLALVGAFLGFCIVVGTVSRRVTFRSYLLLLLVTALLIGLTLVRFYLDI